ncbi:potassium/proton antiporter [Desulfallas thermosapovorans]|uniref:Cell volume regulation protein A n=1 Tax=Desulfallas thermosapovorans DSM 6562 TaxID=1121431 RepID=A0A5S4ZQF8_9FIRM|nr:potassium/proton antiporter [Desulfallas thermosapovorans]TYO95108.1 cell volume regulation protein A [Desulfallas thermosapovorans DSM 6562]
MNSTDQIIFLFAILLIAGIITTRFSARLGVPSLILYIAVGMFLNNFIYFDNASLAQLGAMMALVVILFEGGMQTRWEDVRPVLIPSISLATVGVLLTSLSIGVLAKLILDITWLEGLLFGAIVGSTDAAAVFAVLGDKNIKPRLKTTLEAESGSNDPMAVFLTISFIQLIQMPDMNFLGVFLSFFWQMGFGLAMGILMGKLAVWSINKINFDTSGLYPVLALGFAVFTYGSTALLKGSGIVAVYVAGLVVGNADLTFRQPIVRFHEGFAWMSQILLFTLLGLLVFPNELFQVTWQGIVISALLIFVARPIAVFISTTKMGFSLRDKTLISWSGLRGAVPVVLATYPLVAGLENSSLIFNVVFFVVLTSALIQGSTISYLANLLGLTAGEKVTPTHTLELVSMGKTNTEIMEIIIKEESNALNREVQDLNLPKDVLIAAIIRNDKVITPYGGTKILLGDILYVMVHKTKRESVKKVFLPQKDPKNRSKDRRSVAANLNKA